MSAPPVTVVIPTYERQTALRRALESVATQDYEGRVEAVVVDNSEGESARPVVDDFGFATYRWQLEHVPRQETGIENAAASRDLGIYFASGEYVHLLDDDDEIAPSAIRRKVAAVREDAAAEGAYGAVQLTDGTVKHVPESVVGNELAFVLTNLRPPTPVSGLLIRREILLDCPPLRTLPHDDLGALVEVLLRTPLAYVDTVLTYLGGEHDTAQSLPSQRGRLRTYERYAGLRAQLLTDELQREAERIYERLKRRVRQMEASDSEPS